jgi:flagellar hook assembly protein FlgD
LIGRSYGNGRNSQLPCRAKPVCHRPAPVTIIVFDLTGKIIRQIKTEASGSETITWDGRTVDGDEVAKGLYLVQIRSERKSCTVKIIKE